MSKNETPIPASPAAPAVINLESPVIRGEQRIESIQLRKPTAGELRGIALADLMKLDVVALQTVIPRISIPTLTSHDVAQMDLPDLLAVGTEVISFFMTKADRAALSPGE